MCEVFSGQAEVGSGVGIPLEKKMNRRKDMVANLRSKAIRWLLSNFANRDSLLVPEITPDAMSRTIFFYYLLMPVTASKLGRLLKAKPPYVERNVVAVVSIKYSMQNAVAFEAAAQQIRMGHAKYLGTPKDLKIANDRTEIIIDVTSEGACFMFELSANLNVDFRFSDNFFSNQSPEIPGNWGDNLPGFIHHSNHSSVSVAQPIVTAKAEFHESKKRKAFDVSESSSRSTSSPQVSESGIKRRNNSGSGKRAKSNKKEEEKPKEVVHVRARRGQPTDSHSLAERIHAYNSFPF
ncbi:hypothetical protein CRYUN_Cryun14cG0049600 [Craigia yunnanensis]